MDQECPCAMCRLERSSVISLSDIAKAAFRNWLGNRAAMEGADADHPVATEREAVAANVARTIKDLRLGRVTRKEAIDLKGAAERAISDIDVAGSIGRIS
jgi:hypothetical protein